MTTDTPYAKAICRMEQSAVDALVQLQLPFMHTDPVGAGEDGDALHLIVEAERESDSEETRH
jgi:hypothetical protein